MTVIDRFSGGYRFLSNFYPCKVEYENLIYPSVEHAYQAAKSFNPIDRKSMQNVNTAGGAKRLGRSFSLRRDWEEVKIDIMKELLATKFDRQPLRNMLLATGVAFLIEGNNWGDDFWGVYTHQGKNHLGKLLMEIRDTLREIS